MSLESLSILWGPWAALSAVRFPSEPFPTGPRDRGTGWGKVLAPGLVCDGIRFVNG